MTARRSVLSGVFCAAAILPALLWLWPSVAAHQAPSLRDQGDFFYPLKLYTAGRLRQGEIPLWNPLSGMGEPWLANLQSGVFYPASFLFLLPRPGLAAALFLLFHFGVAAWGMWRFLRDEAVSRAGSLLGAALYCAGGYAASLSAYWNHFGAWAYLPGLLALACAGLPSRSSRLGFAVLAGLQAMSGSPEITAATLGAALALVFFARPRVEDQWAEPTPARALSRAAIAALLGLALAAWALVPMGELLLQSDRRAPLSSEDRETGTAGVPALASALGLSSKSSLATSYLSSLYVGPLALFAAVSAYFERQRRRLVSLLTLAGLAGILFSQAGPPGIWLRSIPPLDRIRYPSKALALTFFALSALSGLGADSLRFLRGGSKCRIAVAAGAAAALGLTLCSPLPPRVRWAAVVGIVALLLLGLGLTRSSSIGAALEAAAAIALTISLALAGRPLFTFVQEEEIGRIPGEVAPLSRLVGRVLTPPMHELAQNAIEIGAFGDKTIRRQRESLLGYTNLLSGVPTVRTAAALPTRGARAIANTIDAADDPARAAGPVSARVLWTPFRPDRLPSRKIGDFFRAPLAPYRPRLSFVRAYRIEPDADRAWRRVAGGQIDLTREVLLDREPKTRIAGEAGKPLLLARLAEDRPERVVAEITSSEPGLLVLTDLAYPGWTAQADGQPAELRVADGFLRAVPLTAGSHRVVFQFRPLSVLIGAGLSAVAAITLLGLAAFSRPAGPRSLL